MTHPHTKAADATAALHRAVQQQQDQHDSATPSAPVQDDSPVQTGARNYPGLPCRRNIWTSRAWKPTWHSNPSSWRRIIAAAAN